MDHIILREIKIENTIVYFRLETRGKVSDLFLSKELWIDYGVEMKDVPDSILAIPFVSIVLPLAWVTNATIWMNKIDRTFYNSTFNIRRAYSDLYPNYPLKGKIVPSYIVENEIGKKSDGYMLFSGGIDAHTSYINNMQSIKYLINIQGWYNSIVENNVVAESDFNDISIFAADRNLRFYGFRSNFAQLVSVKKYGSYAKKVGDSLWHGFQHSMAFISITIPFVYKNGGGEILIASSFSVGDERVCASYPTTDNEFRYAKYGLVKHDGFEFSRQDKIKIIVDYQRKIGEKYIVRVCSFNNHNCCKCEKCFRTILGLIAEGANPSDFGFYLDQPILKFYQDYFRENLALFGVRNELITHWPHIKNRMRENYENLSDYKDFVDWFLSYDFVKKKREALIKYYVNNFFSILKRKLKMLSNRL